MRNLSSGSLAAHICSPLRSFRAFEQRDDPPLETVLRRNKVPLATLPRMNLLPLARNALERPLLRELMREEEASLIGQANRFKELSDDFDQAGVVSVLFKSAGEFPYKSDNLDVLVPRPVTSLAKTVLLDHGYTPLKHWDNEPDKFLFRNFRHAYDSMTIHLHQSVQWDGPAILDLEVLFARTRLADGHGTAFRYPSPEDAALIALGHFFWENRYFGLLDLKLLNDSARHGIDWDEVIRVADQHCWGRSLQLAILCANQADQRAYEDRIFPTGLVRECAIRTKRMSRVFQFAIAASDSRTLPLTIPRVTTKPFTYARLLSRCSSRSPRNVGYIGLDIMNAVLIVSGVVRRKNQKPYVIAISGIDGSGKSTLARAIGEALNGCEIENEIIWTRTRFSPLTEKLKRMLRGTNPRFPDPGDEKSKEELRRTSASTQAAWQTYFLIHLTLRLGLVVRLKTLTRKVVICDRHLLDNLVDLGIFLNDEHPETRFASRLLQKLIRQPNVHLVLDLSPSDAQQRQPEGIAPVPEESRRGTDLFRRLRRSLDRPVVVQADESLDEVRDRAVVTVFHRYYEVYRNRAHEYRHGTQV